MQQQKTYRLKGIVELFISKSKDGCSIGFLKAQITAPGDEIEAVLKELVKDGTIEKAGKGYFKNKVQI